MMFLLSLSNIFVKVTTLKIIFSGWLFDGNNTVNEQFFKDGANPLTLKNMPTEFRPYPLHVDVTYTLEQSVRR